MFQEVTKGAKTRLPCPEANQNGQLTVLHFFFDFQDIFISYLIHIKKEEAFYFARRTRKPTLKLWRIGSL